VGISGLRRAYLTPALCADPDEAPGEPSPRPVSPPVSNRGFAWVHRRPALFPSSGRWGGPSPRLKHRLSPRCCASIRRASRSPAWPCSCPRPGASVPPQDHGYISPIVQLPYGATLLRNPRNHERTASARSIGSNPACQTPSPSPASTLARQTRATPEPCSLPLQGSGDEAGRQHRRPVDRPPRNIITKGGGWPATPDGSRVFNPAAIRAIGTAGGPRRWYLQAAQPTRTRRASTRVIPAFMAALRPPIRISPGITIRSTPPTVSAAQGFPRSTAIRRISSLGPCRAGRLRRAAEHDGAPVTSTTSTSSAAPSRVPGGRPTREFPARSPRTSAAGYASPPPLGAPSPRDGFRSAPPSPARPTFVGPEQLEALSQTAFPRRQGVPREKAASPRRRPPPGERSRR